MDLGVRGCMRLGMRLRGMRSVRRRLVKIGAQPVTDAQGTMGRLVGARDGGQSQPGRPSYCLAASSAIRVLPDAIDRIPDRFARGDVVAAAGGGAGDEPAA